MKIYVIGNPLIAEDSLPLKLLPMLRKTFTQGMFEEADPNENFIPEERGIIIDTVKGIEAPTWFDSLDAFEEIRSVTPHDYDLGLHLRLLMKLKKIHSVTILGIPATATPDEVVSTLRSRINST